MNKIQLRALVHYSENSDKPIFELLMKRRRGFWLIAQLFKTLIFQATVFGDDTKKISSLPANTRVGVSITNNQTVQLLKHCDVVLILDRRAAVSHEHKEVLFVFAESYTRYIRAFVLVFFRVLRSDKKKLPFCDIIAKMETLSLSSVSSHLRRFKKPIYVSNLNSPLVHFLTASLASELRWAHLPHAAIGNSVLPDPNLVSLYFAYDGSELKKIKRVANKTRCYQISTRLQNTIVKSRSGFCCLVLPKNLWDVDFNKLTKYQAASWHLKFHPATDFLQSSAWAIKFCVLMGSIPKIEKSFNHKCKMFSCSSSAVFELLKSGKCVYRLPMVDGGINHYNIDQFLLEKESPESHKVLKEQRRKILGNI